MKKDELLPNDILKFQNGKQIILSENNFWVIRQFYDDDLDCPSNQQYNIIAVFRPYYDLVYSKINEVSQKR